jgi:transposase
MRGIECCRARAVGGNRCRPKPARKHIERAQIILASADRPSAQQVTQIIGVSRPTVWRWQQRFAESGIDDLLCDRTRRPGKAPIAAETAARVVAMACTEPPHQATNWTGRATSASWLNAVEYFFSMMTRQRIRRGTFCSVVDLQAAINAYLAEHNANPNPFVWTKSAETILAKLERCPVPSV